MMDVLFPGLEKSEDVIQIHKDESAEHVSKHVVHQRLKDSWSISESERHYEVFIVPQRGVGCHFPLVFLLKSDQIR